MVRKRDLITSTEHHGEGILEFHVIDPTHAVSPKECLLASVLFAAAIVGRIYFGAEKLATWELASLGGAVLMFLLRRMSHIQQESLLVVHDLGVQVRRAYYSGKTDFEFVERSRIRDVIINEGVRHTTVSYYLAIMVKDSSQMLLGFSELIPNLPHLLVAYHGLRNVLFGDELPEEHRQSPEKPRASSGASGGGGWAGLSAGVGGGDWSIHGPEGDKPPGQRSLYLGGEEHAMIWHEGGKARSLTPSDTSGDSD